MANATPIRIGLVNNNSTPPIDPLELFFKVFGGEVLAAFETKSVSLDKHQIRTISSGEL